MPATSYREKQQARRAVIAIGETVDEMAEEIEEFGQVSMSSPLLTLPTSKLEFGLDKTARNYYDNARSDVAGRALSAVAIAHRLGVDLQGTADLDQIASARALARSLAPDRSARQELAADRDRRADIAYRRVMAEAEDADTPAERLAIEERALIEKGKVLKEPLPDLNPAIDVTAPSAGPDLPGSAGANILITDTKKKEEEGKDGAAAVGGTGAGAGGGSGSGDTNAGGNTVKYTVVNGAPRVDNDLSQLEVLQATLTALGQKDKGGLNAAGDALFSSTLALPDIDAVKIAESASSLQGLMNFFHHPTEAMQFKDKIVMMGAVTVSVMPGWRTRKDWAGEVVMVNSYSWTPARREVVERMTRDWTLPRDLRIRLSYDYQLPLPEDAADDPNAIIRMKSGGPVGSGNAPVTISGNPHGPGVWIPPAVQYDERAQKAMMPLVSGISPLQQSDTHDLVSSFQRQDEFAIALAGMLSATGWKAQARIFDQYVKKQRKEVQTRSTSASVATYSRAGGVVGFQIGPRLKALADPAGRSPKSAFILERQSFPALLVYGLDAADIYPRIKCEGNHLVVYEAKLKNTQRSYWQPQTQRFQGPKDYFNPFKVLWPPAWWEPALRRDRIAAKIMDHHDALWDAGESIPGDGDPDSRRAAVRGWAKEMQDEGNELISRFKGAWNDQFLPAEVQVPLGYVPLPDRPKLAVLPKIQVVKPASVTRAKPEKPAADKPAPLVEPVTIWIRGHGLNAVRDIRPNLPDGVVEMAPIDSEIGELFTKRTADEITIHARVNRSAVLSFELDVDPVKAALPAGSPAPMFHSPPTLVMIGTDAPITASLSSGNSRGSFGQERPSSAAPVGLIAASPPLVAPGIAEVRSAPPESDSFADLALFPDALPALVPVASSGR